MRQRFFKLCFPLLLLFVYLPISYANLRNTSYAYHTAYPIIKSWFTSITQKNLAEASKLLAKQFISLHTDARARNKTEELTLIRHLNMRLPTITNFQAIRNNNVIIATYRVAVAEYINGKLYSTQPMPRMTILQRNKKGRWLILAHVNLSVPKS